MVVLFIGKERCDIPYYICRMATALNKKTLIVDNSMKNDFFEIFAEATETEEIKRSSFKILKDVAVTDKDTEGYDFVFVYNGLYDFKKPYAIKADVLITCTSSDAIEAKALKKCLETMNTDAKHRYFLYRDAESKKVSIRTMMDYLGLTDELAFIMPLDTQEIAKYQVFTQTRKNSLVGINEYTAEFIYDFSERLFGINPKMFRKTFNGGKKW